ncbi:MAG: hypothetical protein AMXMBFR84_03690 [Candidatus Hydrogenedentota bacterium]
MKIVAYAFGAAGVAALAGAVVGKFQGHPEFFLGAQLISWITLSGSLTLLGILAALLDKKE